MQASRTWGKKKKASAFEAGKPKLGPPVERLEEGYTFLPPFLFVVSLFFSVV